MYTVHVHVCVHALVHVYMCTCVYVYSVINYIALYVASCRLHPISGQDELEELQLGSASGCSLHGPSTMRWRRVPFLRLAVCLYCALRDNVIHCMALLCNGDSS